MKCSHGRNSMFCCICSYGYLRQEQERPRDMVDDINMGVGYKLKAGFALQDKTWEEM